MLESGTSRGTWSSPVSFDPFNASGHYPWHSIVTTDILSLRVVASSWHTHGRLWDRSGPAAHTGLVLFCADADSLGEQGLALATLLLLSLLKALSVLMFR